MFRTVAKLAAFCIVEVILIAQIARDATHARDVGYGRRMNDDLITRKLQIEFTETFTARFIRCHLFCQDRVDLCLRDSFCCRYFYLCHNTSPYMRATQGFALIFYVRLK